MEAGTAVIAKGWNVDDILDWLKKYGASIEKDNEGQIIYTDLYENEEGGLSVL